MKIPKHVQIDRVDFGGSSQTGGWIVSYADMMTIILTFFILLLSISTIAQTKYELLVQAFTGEKAGNLMEVKEEIDKVIEEQNLGGEIATKLNKDGLTIEFSNALLFTSGDANLKPSGLKAFEPIQTHLLGKLHTQYGLVIEGYTDDVPINNARYRSNWDLSTSRAIHVMEKLTASGMDKRRISVKGYANTRPATEIDISNPDAMKALSDEERTKVRAANRRVIIRIDALDPEIVKRLSPVKASDKTATDQSGNKADGKDATPKTTDGEAPKTDAKSKSLKPFELPKKAPKK